MGKRLAWHAVAVAALVINLWLGGAYVEAWLGHLARAAFEIALIAAYVLVVLGTRFVSRRRP
ncbi:MAG: hypothetical protein FJ035_07185 [Chloroflexi bacterium]|nr:hypothetical protein [Chloroflexota bacterium]